MEVNGRFKILNIGLKCHEIDVFLYQGWGL